MKIPHLENSHVKLTLMDLSNYKYVQDIAAEKDLIFYSPSGISTPEELRHMCKLPWTDITQKQPFHLLFTIKQNKRMPEVRALDLLIGKTRPYILVGLG